MNEPVKAIVLAAGKGTRLRTEGVDLPKVLRVAAGRPLLGYVLEELGFLKEQDILLVVGYEGEKVTAAFPGYPKVFQCPQLGTGHAVQCAEGAMKGFEGDILIAAGDMPLLPRRAYEALVAQHRAEGNVCTILAAVAEKPMPMGRIVRNPQGGFARIVEDQDCTAEEKKICEINTSVYVFDARSLWRSLTTLRPNNAQGEYYLTDAPAWLVGQGEKVGVCAACTAQEMLGVNTVEQLQEVEDYIEKRGQKG
ncbi:MAG: NTP transferase domain-containing protein [Oscillospiraceae bacterium]|jgi:UDP-N-acetylglucosamine diphosphorylase/glucosamine-1-phosphate N-acetyltransferase|nr:NTP transferase domain-containing protein [Oscillospiraceae bacterium]